MALENCILLGVNEISTVAATSESGDYVASNLINTQPSEIWQATEAVTQVLTGALNENSIIGGFALSNHNLVDETVQLELSIDSGYSNIVYSNTWSASNPFYGWGEGTWGNLYSTWGGYLLDDGGLTSQLIETFDNVGANYWRVTISNISTRIPEAGTIYLGPKFQPARNVTRGPSIPVIDPSSITMTRGQGMRSDNQRTFREIRLRWQELTTDEAHAFRRICRNTGRRGLMVLNMRPGIEGIDESENKMICRMVDWDGPQFDPDTYETMYSASATFREAL